MNTLDILFGYGSLAIMGDKDQLRQTTLLQVPLDRVLHLRRTFLSSRCPDSEEHLYRGAFTDEWLVMY